MEPKKFETEIAGRKLVVETGLLAKQANASVTVRYGDTVVLATAVMSPEAREGVNYFPLMVDYEEKFYASGKIKGSRFIKREGRPTDEAVLNGRLIDRTLRPLFDQRMRNEVQVIVTVLSIDQENDPALVGNDRRFNSSRHFGYSLERTRRSGADRRKRWQAHYQSRQRRHCRKLF